MEDITNRRLTNAKKILCESTADLQKEAAAMFYSELADWAYSQSETLTVDAEPEMQDYENE